MGLAGAPQPLISMTTFMNRTSFEGTPNSQFTHATIVAVNQPQPSSRKARYLVNLGIEGSNRASNDVPVLFDGIELEAGERTGPEPVGRRNAGVIYGLGNLVENAVDFARSAVTVRWSWNDDHVTFTVIDDGPGFPPEILDRIGEPYMSTRQGAGRGGGLGLGMFIAKTLLERSGATIEFRNSSGPGQGAVVHVGWPRQVFLNPEAAAGSLLDTA